ncbi:MAG: hypothetical protein AAFR59_07440 [Bacteroidota bacterium]
MKNQETALSPTLQDLKPGAPYVSVQQSSVLDSVDLNLFIYNESNFRLVSYMERPDYTNRQIDITVAFLEDGGTHAEFFKNNFIPVDYTKFDNVNIQAVYTIGELETLTNTVVPVGMYDANLAPPIAGNGVSPEGVVYDIPYGYITEKIVGEETDYVVNYFLLSPSSFNDSECNINTLPPYRVVQVNLVPIIANGQTLIVKSANTGPLSGANGEPYLGAEIFVDDYRPDGQRGDGPITPMQKTTRGPVILSYVNIDEDTMDE